MEHWKEIHISDDYPFSVEVSTCGRVRRGTMHYTRTTLRGTIVQTTKPPCVLAGEIGHNGYRYVAFYINKKRHRLLVHRLVAQAFVDSYEARLSVNHINGNKLDNRPENLEWVTLAENTSKQWQTGLVNLRGDANPQRKISSTDVPTIRARVAAGDKVVQIARDYGVSDSLIALIGKGERWRHV